MKTFRELLVLDLETGEERARAKHPTLVHTLSVCEDGRLVASPVEGATGTPSEVDVLELKGAKLRRRARVVTGHPTVSAVWVSADGLLVTGGSDGGVEVYEV